MNDTIKLIYTYIQSAAEGSFGSIRGVQNAAPTDLRCPHQGIVYMSRIIYTCDMDVFPLVISRRWTKNPVILSVLRIMRIL
jgi:hypothetical protein